MQQLPQALAPLGHFAQWVLWISVPDAKRPGKTNKFPINPSTGEVVSAHDPANWLTFDNAARLLPQSKASGVGFVFTVNDPFFFIDIDDAYDGTNWSVTSQQLGQQFAGAAVEISSSGKGAHIIGTCSPVPHGCKNTPLGLELYTEGRFVALTGTNAQGDAFQNCQAQFEQLVNGFFPPRLDERAEEWTDTACAGWLGPDNDDELITKALASTSAGAVFGDRASFNDLWFANESVLSVAFPSTNDIDAWGKSEAEAALCSHLAFWTGRNCERIDRLFKASQLMRDKWEREDYAQSTVLLACTGSGDVYNNSSATTDESLLPGADAAVLQQQAANAPVTADTPVGQPVGSGDAVGVDSGVARYSSLDQFMGITEQFEYFKDCVYVTDEHKIITPGGIMLDQGRFKAKFGGTNFCLDASGGKTSRNAWEAFTESITLAFPKVDTTTFAPEKPPGEVVDIQGISAVNTYWPAVIKRTPGDATLFINHINKLLPNGDDARILLTYMAALIQNPGQKFQWCPLLQSVEGNGKTLIIECLTNAVGEKYTHLPNAKDLGGNGSTFTKWLTRRLFVGVEEIYCADRRELIETLKPLITNRRIEIQAKGVDQETGDNRTNWVMMTNHKDAIPITVDSRRYCVLFCAQQTLADLNDCGMSEAYFTKLYDWLRYSDGFAVVNDFLHTYKCEAQFDPSEQGNARRAPKTTSTSEALILSAGVIEQEVLEAVEQGRSGFCAPWISSMALDALLKEVRRTLPNVKRPEMLRTLGYVPHPHLQNGRTNGATLTDGGKPRLYITDGSLVANLTCGAEIAKRYDADQKVAPSAASNVFTGTK